MKTSTLLAAAAGCLALAMPMLATPAAAQGFRDHPRFGRACRTERTVKFTPFGRKVVVRRVCR